MQIKHSCTNYICAMGLQNCKSLDFRKMSVTTLLHWGDDDNLWCFLLHSKCYVVFTLWRTHCLPSENSNSCYWLQHPRQRRHIHRTQGHWPSGKVKDNLIFWLLNFVTMIFLFRNYYLNLKVLISLYWSDWELECKMWKFPSYVIKPIGQVYISAV